SMFGLLLFSYSFPFNRPAPRWLIAAAGAPALLLLGLSHPPPGASAYIRTMLALYFLPVVAAAVYFQHRNRDALVREAGREAPRPIRIVQASIAVPWVLGTLIMMVATSLRAGPPPQSVIVAQSLLSTVFVMVGVAVAVMRYHLLDIRVMAY